MLPTGKKSKSKRDMRRAHHDTLTLPQVGSCENCGGNVLSHRACPACGWYNGRVAVAVRVNEIEPDEEETLGG